MGADAYKVLLVEDNPGDARLLEMSFRESGSADFSVLTVSRLDQACAILADQTFDVVILDLGLPDSSGVDTIDAAFAMTHEKRIPVVALSGSIEQESAVEVVLHGAQEALEKTAQPGNDVVRSVRLAIARQTSLNRAEDRASRARTESELQTLSGPGAGRTALDDRLSDSDPEAFAWLVNRYSNLIERAYEKQHLGVENGLGEWVHALSQSFVDRRADPRDVIDCHLAAVKSKLGRVDQHRARFVNDAARVLMIEIIGDLASSYRDSRVG